MPQVKYIDFFPYSPGDPVAGLRLCEIGGAFFLTADGVTFTTVGGGVTPSSDIINLLAAPATTCPVACNGNASGDFLLDGLYISNGAPSQNFSLLVNGAATNLRARVGDDVAGSSFITTWTWGNTGAYGFAAGSTIQFQGRLNARSGRIRSIYVKGLTNDSNNDMLEMFGQWTDTTTTLTSLALSAGNALGLAAGSYLRLTPLNTNL